MRYTHPRSEFRSSRTFVANLLAFVLLASQLAPLASAQGTRGGARRQQPEKIKSGRPGGGAQDVSPVTAAPLGAPAITATKVDSFPDVNADGKADPGETITYTVTITNTGGDPATGVAFNDTVDPNTTLIPGSVNTSPIVAADAYNVVGNVRIQPNAAQGLLANDIDPDTGNSTGLTVTVLAGDNTAPFAGTSAQGGQVTSSATDGSFAYNPPAGFAGSDTFSYTVSDGTTTDTATVTLQVGNGTATPGTNVIWFVNSAAPAGGDGRLTNPFNCLVGTGCFDPTAADEAGDSIFLYAGTYADTAALTLLNNQKLIGQGTSAGTTLAAVTAVTVQPYSDPLPVFNGNPASVTVTSAAAGVIVTAGNNNELRGFTLGNNASGAKIQSAAFGTLTVSEVALTGTGQALNLDSGTLAATFMSIASTTAAAQGVLLDQLAGSLTSTGGTSITDPATQCLLVTASTANMSFGDTTCTLATDGISLQNNSAGTRTFGTLSVTGATGVGFLHANGGGAVNVTGATTITNPAGVGIDVDSSNANLSFAATTVNKGSTSNIGVDLTNNATRTIGFASLDVTTTNAFALNTSASGTVNAGGGSLTQSGAGGGAASLVNTALGLSFTSVSSNGGANGVIINVGSGTFASGTTNLQNNAGAGLFVISSSVAANFGNTTVNSSSGNAVDLQNNTGAITFADLDLTPDANVRGLSATGSTGTITSTSGDIAATGAPAVFISGPAGRTPLAMTLNNVDSTNSTTLGVDLNLVSGNLTVNDATLATNITNPTGIGIQVRNTGAGTIAFGNTSVTGSGGTGVVLGTTSNGNTGNVTFADLDISPDAGQRALHSQASTGGITVTSGTITTTNGAAGGGNVGIEIVGPSAASRTSINLTFNSVSVNNALSGIVLTNTSDGGNAFRVLGTGTTDGSGGTISNITNRGASFIDANDIVLNNMTFTNVGTVNGDDPLNASGNCGGLQSGTNTNCNAGIHANGVTGLTLTNVDLTTGQQQGINGNNVTNFVFSNSNVSGFGNQTNEVGVRFNNLLGASSMTNVHVFNNHSFQVEIQNESGTLSSFPVSNSEFNHSGTGVANGVDGMLFSAQGTAVMFINVTGCNFHDTFSGGFFSDSKGTAAMDITIQTSTFERFGSVPITIAKAESANVQYDILNNATIRDAGRDASGVGHGININKASPSVTGTTIQGTISGNTIGESADTADTDDKGSGIRMVSISQGAFIATVTNNNVQDFRERGIFAQMSESPATGNSMALNITNNTVNNPEAVAEHAILVTAGAITNDTGTLCANITGNNSTSAGGDGIRVRATQLTTVILPGYAGTPNDTTQLTAFVDANNPATTDTISAARLGSATMTGGAACSTPAAPIRIDAAKTAAQHDGSLTDIPAAPQQFILPVVSQPVTAAGRMLSAPAATRPAPVAAAVTASSAKTEQDATEKSAAKSGDSAKSDKSAKAAAVAAPLGAPNTVSVNIGTLVPGDSVTITFQVTVNNPFPAGVTQVSNQGTVSGANFSNVLTDDPSVGGASDPTVTPVQGPPDINIRDASVSEPASGSSVMAFTVTLSAPSTNTVSVNFTTADEPAGPGKAVAGVDYTTTSGTLTFAPGQLVQTASVPVLSDADAAEPNETFLVNLSAPVNGNIVDGQAVGTITAANPAGTTLISELRTSGPGTTGTGDANDEFVEVYNNTDAPVTVAASDASPGWGLFKMGAACGDTPVLVGTIPNGTVIPARGHYLFVGSGYSLAGYAAGNQTLTAGIEDDRNVGLFNTTTAANLATGTRLDAAGFGTNTGNNCDLLREGATLAAASGSVSQHTFVRNQTTGVPLDRNDNAGDFLVLSTTPGTAVGATATPRLGAPGPENLASPINRSVSIKPGLVDPGALSSVAPNRVRDLTPDPANNSTFGTLAIRRKFTNMTGGALTRLRFRVIDITTAPVPAGTADLRVRTSSTSTVSLTGGGTAQVQGLTLETPPAQPNGGGWNSTLAAGTITVGTPLAAGASINVEFLLGLQQTGTFRFFIIVEAVPGGPPFGPEKLGPDAKGAGRDDFKDVPQN